MGTQASEIFTQRVNKMMRQRYLTKKEMAERLNVDYSTFWRKLNGQRNVDISLLTRIAEILGTTVSYLMGETDNSERSTDVREVIPVQDAEPAKATSYAYWGGVVDEVNNVLERGNIREINLVEPLLKTAYENILSWRDGLKRKNMPVDTDSAVVVNAPVYGGHHNSSNTTVKTV